MKAKKLKQLYDYIRPLQEEAANKMNNEPVQYWRGGDWQVQGLEKAYTEILNKIEDLMK